MSGEITFTSVAIDRARYLNDWADRVETLLQNPTKGNIANATVDVILLSGMEEQLYALINKVDAKARGQLNDILLNARNKIEKIDKDLHERITSLNNASLKAETVPGDVVDLQAKAQKIFEELQIIDDTLFEDPQTALNTLDLKTKEIAQIRQATTEQKTIQTLSRAEEKIQTIRETVYAFYTPSVIAPKPTKDTSPRFFFADQNQYSDQYDKCYQGTAYKRSACTAIAGHFVLATMQGADPNKFNDIMLSGQKTNARMMHDNPPVFGEHFEFPDLLEEKEFADLRQLDIPENILQDDPFFMNIDILRGKEAFREKIAALRQIQNKQNLEFVGSVITARGESYGLVIFKDQDLIVFFDSHGCQNLTQSPNGYAAVFQSTGEAAKFLAERMPVVKDIEDPHYNTATLTPVCLKTATAHLADQTGENDNFEPPIVNLGNLTLNKPLVVNLLAQAKTLGNAADLFAQKDEENSIMALALLTELINEKCQFAMSGNEPKSIGDRPSFHLYQIQDKESPEKVDRNDPIYGTNAMQSTEKSTPEERTRAVQRTAIEVAFADMENAINDQALINGYLDLLEGLKVDAKDMPKDKKNIAHYLYERLYYTYLDACKDDNSLVHPHDQAFKGDFGRTAFRGEGDVLIPLQFKLDVIRQVRDELKQLWIK